jgi:predicted RNA-binding Zn ribbon-like protein
MSTWLATERYGLAVVPGSLALVQDFLNTRSIMGKEVDLLAGRDDAHRWWDSAIQAWSVASGLHVALPTLGSRGPAQLRQLRALIDDWQTGELSSGPTSLPGAASFGLDATGQLRWVPTGDGASWLSSALWSEIALAQAAGTRSRLKRCRNPQCRSAFYDKSKNNSSVWHDFKVCGNAVNLRASRARRRAVTP